MRLEGEGIERRRSKVEVYLHFVWTVKYRAPLLTSLYERDIYRCITAKAEECGNIVLAIGGVPDHVHLLVRFGSKEGIATVVRLCKSASSSLYNSLRPANSEPFQWQDGYGCFSLFHSHVDKVQRYIHEQKERHAENRLWPEFEEFDAPVPSTKQPQ